MQDGPILVTGGAGYIGSVLVRRLLNDDVPVRVIDVQRFGNESLLELAADPRCEVHQVDVRDETAVEAIVRGCGAVVHLAAIVGDPACNKEPELAAAVNRDAAKRLYALAAAAGCPRFVFASTCSNYGCVSGSGAFATEETVLAPLSRYATTKVDVERFLLAQPSDTGCKAVCLRFATAYGLSPRMRFDLTVNDFTRTLRRSEELIVFGRSTWRPYCHVSDLADAMVLALRAPDEQVAFKVFNVGETRENYTKQMIVDAVLKRIPDGHVTYQQGASSDTRDYRVDCSRIRQVLGFRPQRRVADGIAEIVAALERGCFGDGLAARYHNV